MGVRDPASPAGQGGPAASAAPPGFDGGGLDVAREHSDLPLDRQLALGAAPTSRRSAGMWLLFGALGFLIGQVVGAVFSVLAAIAQGKLHSLSAVANLSEPPTWYIVSTLLGLWVGFLGGPLMASTIRGTRSLIRDVGLRFKWIDLIGIPIGVAGQFLVVAIYIPISPHVHNFSQKFNAPSQKLTGGSHGIGFAVIAVLTVAGAPFFEEVFFRGLLLRSLTRLFGNFGRGVGPALAIVITGVLFGLAHAESLQLLGLATFGVILSFISYRTGRLGMNMAAHAAFNLVAVVATLAAGTGVLF